MTTPRHDTRHMVADALESMGFAGVKKQSLRPLTALALLTAMTLFDVVPHDHRVSAPAAESVSGATRSSEQLSGCSKLPDRATHLHRQQNVAAKPCVACLRQLLDGPAADAAIYSVSPQQYSYVREGRPPFAASALESHTSRGPPLS